jgi:hypothetical protein
MASERIGDYRAVTCCNHETYRNTINIDNGLINIDNGLINIHKTFVNILLIYLINIDNGLMLSFGMKNLY